MVCLGLELMGGSMEGSDESTELGRHPNQKQLRPFLPLIAGFKRSIFLPPHHGKVTK